jgi:hypothetical protein
MKFHRDGIRPDGDQIFVFGSNLAGVHGAGAAKMARLYYGAKHGVGIGPAGTSYAIPTKDKEIETLSLDIIRHYVWGFIRYTQIHPELEFFVTRVGCGLAGYRDQDIAPMFKECGDNCSFAEQWREYIES